MMQHYREVAVPLRSYRKFRSETKREVLSHTDHAVTSSMDVCAGRYYARYSTT